MPTATPTFDLAPSLEPSATFYPYIPTEPADAAIGRSNPTSAALAAEGEPSQEAPTVILPTLASFPLQFFADDGTLINVQFFGASTKPAASLFLLHDYGQDSDAWYDQALQFQTAGFNVFVPDLRGYGVEFESLDWALLANDVQAIERNIETTLPDVVNRRLMMLGLGSGANVAFAACASLPNCSGLVLISPRPTLNNLTLEENLSDYANRSALIVSADDDPDASSIAQTLNSRLSGDYSWQRYSGGGRGTALMRSQASLTPLLIEWVQARLP